MISVWSGPGSPCGPANPDGARPPPLTFDATSYYLALALTMRRTAQLLPEVRLLVLLRDLVVRAWSHYRVVRLGLEPLSFEAAIAQGPVRLAGEGQGLSPTRTTRQSRTAASPSWPMGLRRTVAAVAGALPSARGARDP